MFERFVEDARAAVMRAHDEAHALGADSVRAEHFLLALAAPEFAVASKTLHAAGLHRDGVLDALQLEQARSLALVGITDAPSPLPATASDRKRLAFASSAKIALERALRAAVARGDHRITSGHVLLGVLHADVGTVPRALEAAGIDRVELLAAVESAL